MISNIVSKDQVNEYISDAIRIENADGRVEWFKENDVVQALTSKKEKAVLNTSDADKGNDQRYLRTLIAQMRAYVEPFSKRII